MKTGHRHEFVSVTATMSLLAPPPAATNEFIRLMIPVVRWRSRKSTVLSSSKEDHTADSGLIPTDTVGQVPMTVLTKVNYRFACPAAQFEPVGRRPNRTDNMAGALRAPYSAPRRNGPSACRASRLDPHQCAEAKCGSKMNRSFRDEKNEQNKHGLS